MIVVCVLCVTCMCPPYIFLVNGIHFILASLIQVKHHFSFIIIIYIIIVIIIFILLVVDGEFSKWIWVAWSTPNHWLFWVIRRLSSKLFFVSFSLVTTVGVFTSSFIFIIWHHLIMIPKRKSVLAFLLDVIWEIAR